MSSFLVTGEPGAGKSLYTTRELVGMIARTNLSIVTNMPVRLDPWLFGGRPMMGLRAYLQKNYDDTFDIDKRFRAITDEMCSEFYRYRGGGIDLDVSRDKAGNPEELDIQTASNGVGVIYIIDECWKFFGARDWQTTGKALTFYAKQHRKLGDEIWLCTHDYKDVDTAIRRVVEQTIVMRNHGRMRIGWFRQPRYFTAEHYARIPSGNVSPMNTERFTLDAEGLCQCYDTSAGVGLAGGVSADTKQKKTGLHFGFLIGLVAIIALLATQLPLLLGKVLGKATLVGAKSGTKDAFKQKPALASNSVVLPPAVPLQPPEAPTVTPRPLTALPPAKPAGLAPLPEESEVNIVGMYQLPGSPKVFIKLSNGETYSSEDKEMEFITERFVVILHKVYRWPKLAPALKQTIPLPYTKPTSSMAESQPHYKLRPNN